MLLKRILFIAVYISLIVSGTLTAQVKFPVGIYSNIRAGSLNENARLDSIKSLGINWIIHESRNNINKTKLENNFDSIIASNCYSNTTDAIHYYSSGCYSKWAAKENAADANIGIKHGFGKKIAVGADSCWTSDTVIAHRGEFVIRGPNYYQDKYYKIPQRSDLIQYQFKIRLKRGSDYLGGSTDTLALIYITDDDIDLIDPVVIRVNQVSTNFTDTTFLYDLRNYQYRGGVEYNLPSHMNRYNSVVNENTNVQFKIKWFGNYELIVDYIEVMDLGIWGDYLTNNPDAINKIQAQVTTFNSWTKLKYFYSLDEPASVDNYVPYKTIQNIVAGYGGKPLISALVPLDVYEKSFNGEKSIPRWVNMATPEKLLFDLYPFNVNCYDSTRVDSISAQFNFLRDVCGAANRYKKNNYYYVGQAHGYFLASKPAAYLRQPSINELRASSLLALAHGAKGLFYYSYNSSSAKDTTLIQLLKE